MTLTLKVEDKPPKMFFFDADWTDPDVDTFCESLFEKYFSKYAVGRETSKSGHKHYQALVIGDTKGYTNFIAAIKRKWNLRGRATKGLRRQYGATKGIKNKENALAYVLKEKNYFTKGYHADVIAEAASRSYIPPPNKREKMDRMNDKMEEIIGEDDIRIIVKYIIEEWFKIFDNLPTRNAIYRLLYKHKHLTSETYGRIIMGHEYQQFDTQNHFFSHQDHHDSFQNNYRY